MPLSVITELFATLWRPYAAATPQAEQVRRLLEQAGETVVNDHVAFRTFDVGPYPMQIIAQPFVDLGYVHTGDYNFTQKKLDAISLSHPEPGHPRVFVSQLRVQELPAPARSILHDLIDKIPHAPVLQAIASEIEWPVPTYANYLALAEHSEYAAWLSAFGIRVNHFTVSVNSLRVYTEIAQINAFLQEQGYALNGSPDREIQGGPQLGLEQSSTLAQAVPWTLQDQRVEIPSCYYEFAKRYPLAGQTELFDGFVTQSADKIFESTDRRN